MRNFVSIMKSFSLHSQTNKKNLWSLYASAGDGERTYRYENLGFYFTGTSARTPEKALMFIDIPAMCVGTVEPEQAIACEDFILRSVSAKINALSDSWQNKNKETSEKAQLCAQLCNENVIRRSGCVYSPEKCVFTLRVMCKFPLENGTWIDVKGGIGMIRSLLELFSAALNSLEKAALERQLLVYARQKQIRSFMRENGLCAFIADGSILPRENRTSAPMEKAVPFSAPADMRVTIPFWDGTHISGMGVRRGVTVVTGGGYSGKSTLLDAIETGIYDRVLGDGREFVLTDASALKICAEDGRPVSNLDLSPFFRYLPGKMSLADFSTLHASGSVSQAASITEAVCGKSALLLIDGDRSATNFMIRDENMRKVVRREPIIPFTDRVRELYTRKGVSTILVIGGSSEYLSCADTVIRMEDYTAENITDEVRALGLPARAPEAELAHWTDCRYLVPRETNQPFLYFRSVSSENSKKIVLDDYSADITALTALVSEAQLGTLAYAC